MNQSRTANNTAKKLSKLVVDWNQKSARLYASNTDLDYIAVWDVEREHRLFTMAMKSAGGVHCIVSDSSGFCAAGMGDGIVRCFDARSPDSASLIIPSIPMPARHSSIITLKPDKNQRLISISNMGQLRRWDIETGHSNSLHVPQTSLNVLAADVHANGNVLALATETALQFKTCFGDLLFDIKNSKFAQVSCLSFHPYRQRLAVGFNDGSLSMFCGKTNSSTG